MSNSRGVVARLEPGKAGWAAKTEISARGGRVGCALGGKGGLHKLLDMQLALGILDGEPRRGTIASYGLFSAAKFGVEISAGKLKQGVGGIFLDKRANHAERFFVLLVVGVKIQGQVKAGSLLGKDAVGNVVLELANAYLLIPAGDAHEEAENLGDGAESVDVIIVESETKLGVDQFRVQLKSAEKMGATVDTRACGGAIFAAKAVKTCRESVGQASIELHFSGFVLLKMRLRDGRSG